MSSTIGEKPLLDVTFTDYEKPSRIAGKRAYDGVPDVHIPAKRAKLTDRIVVDLLTVSTPRPDQFYGQMKGRAVLVSIAAIATACIVYVIYFVGLPILNRTE